MSPPVSQAVAHHRERETSSQISARQQGDVSGDPLLTQAMALAGMGAWSCDLATNRIGWTTGIYDLFGLPAERAVDRRETVGMYTEESRDVMERARAQAIACCGNFAIDAQIVRTDGELRWMRLTGKMAKGVAGSARLYGLKQDITQDRQRLETMRHLAEHDALTGLSNRSVYESRFLDRSCDDGLLTPLGALVLLDMDGFKGINDRFGHAAGDACLRVFAERLVAGFPDAPLKARIGGDEFAMTIGAGMPTQIIQERLAWFLEQLRAPISYREHMITVNVSIGIAVPPDPCRYDPEHLFADADAELYAAKKARRYSSALPSVHRGAAGIIRAWGGMAARWLGWQDSNLRMPVPKTGALPLGYTPSAEGGP